MSVTESLIAALHGEGQHGMAEHVEQLEKTRWLATRIAILFGVMVLGLSGAVLALAS